MKGRIKSVKRSMAFFIMTSMIISSFAGMGTASTAKTAAKKSKNKTAVTAESYAKKDDIIAHDIYDTTNILTTYGEEKASVDVKDAKVTEDYENDGLHIKAVAEDIENGRINFTGEYDFSAANPGYIIFDGVTEKKKPAKANFYIDNQTTPFASVNLTKQKGKSSWSVSKKITSKIKSKVTGKHKISIGIAYDNLSAADKKEKAEIHLRNFIFMAEDIPTVSFDIDESEGLIAEMNSDPEHKTECYGKMNITVPAGYTSEYGGEPTEGTYDMEYIRGRGNSTWGVSKRPYKVKLDKKADLFGMGANKHWVLLANYYDYSMLRNKYTYWLGEQLGLKFTPQCIFVNVVMNGEYLGSYYLCEHVRVGKSRVNIDDLEEHPEAVSGSDVTGGYLLSMGYEGGEMRMISTTRGQDMLIENPDFSENDPVPEQYEYISNYVQETEDAIFGDDFKNADGKSYLDYLDLDSAVDYYLVQEFSANGDGFLSNSTYLYKERDGKLYFGPLWDFDYVAWGATEFKGNDVVGFMQNSQLWFQRLLTDPVFFNRLKERWGVFKSIVSKSVATGGILDQYSKQLYLSAKVNHQASTSLVSDGVDGSVSVDDDCATSDYIINYDNEVQRFKEWISGRAAWFDANIKDIVPKTYKLTFKVNGKKYDTRLAPNGSFDDWPKEPSKKGYAFVGWYYKSGKKKIDFYGGLVEKNLTLYAKFEKIDKIKGGTKLAFRDKTIYVPNDQCETKLPLITYPEKVPFENITWKSSNPSEVTVVDGYVTGASGFSGTATITAKYKGKTAKCTVKILNWEDVAAPYGLKIKKKTITMKKGEYKVLPYSLQPTKSNIVWVERLDYKSQKESVVSVDSDGVLHAKKKGTSVVVVSFGGMIYFYTVKVKKK